MADTRRTGDIYSAGMGIETTTNTYKAPTSYLPYKSLVYDPAVEDVDLDTKIGRRGGSLKTIRTKAEPTVDLSYYAWPENGMEAILKMAFGSASSAVEGATAAYKHTYTESNSLPTASFNKWAGDSIGEPFAATGCMLRELNIGYDGPGPISLDAKFDAGQLDLSKSAPTATYSTADPFVWGDFSVELDGTAKTTCTKASISIANEITSEYGADGSLTPQVKTPGAMTVKGRIEFPWENWDIFKEYISGASIGSSIKPVIKDKRLKLVLSGATIASTYKYDLIFSLPKVNMMKLDAPNDDNAPVKYGFDWQARYYNGTDAGLGTGITIGATSTSKLTAIV